jgi:diguanylate cyclase (GGDEF)-like protein
MEAVMDPKLLPLGAARSMRDLTGCLLSEGRVSDTGQDHATSASGVEPTRLLGNLAELVRLLAEVTTLEEILEIACEHVRAGLRCASVSLSRLEPGTTTLRTLINVGDLGPSEQRRPDDETYSMQNDGQWRGIMSDPQTWRQMWTVTVIDAQAEPTQLALLAELGKQAATTAALVVNDALWGDLYVTYARVDESHGADDYAYLEVYVAIVESALARVAQIQSLERLAYQDPMTGLANRRALDEAAAGAFAKLGHPDMTRMTVVAFDLNGLKEVNDRLGHAEGDRLIISASSLIRTHFNGLPGSLAARVGGDEFVVLVPDHSFESVASAAQFACSAVADLLLGSGASCGIATADGNQGDSSVSDLFCRADFALYRSKGAGRPVAHESAGFPSPTVNLIVAG